ICIEYVCRPIPAADALHTIATQSAATASRPESAMPERTTNRFGNIAWEGKMSKHKRSALSLALAVALSPVLASAQSTTAPGQAGSTATNLDAVQVTGIRRGIENA